MWIKLDDPKEPTTKLLTRNLRLSQDDFHRVDTNQIESIVLLFNSLVSFQAAIRFLAGPVDKCLNA